jgi:hypothetical protein
VLPVVLGYAGAIALGLGAIFAIRTGTLRERLVVGLVLLFVISVGALKSAWPRWLITILPLATTLQAHALVQGARRVGEISRREWVCWAALTALVGIVSFGLLRDLLELRRLERLPSTDAQAMRWIFENVPSDSSIATDHFRAHWPNAEVGLPTKFETHRGPVRFNLVRYTTLDQGGSFESWVASDCRYALVNRSKLSRILDKKPEARMFYDRLFSAGRLRAEFRPNGVRLGPTLQIFELPAKPPA